MTGPLVISSYPLSNRFRSRVGEALGSTPEYVTVADIRVAGPLRWLQRAWIGRARPVYLAVESESSRCLLPALSAVAAALRGSPIKVISPDGSVSRMGVPQVGSSLVRLALASADSMVARCQVRLTRPAIAMSAESPGPSLATGWGGTKILYIKNTLSTGVRAGGSVGHVAGVVNALASAGAEVKMITTEPSPMIREGVDEFHPRGMDVLGLPSQANVFRMQRQTVRRGFELASRWKPDVVYQRLTLGDAAGAQLARKLGVPLIVEYNGSEIWCNRNWGAGVRYSAEFLAAEEQMLRSSSLVFTISRVLADELRARGIPDSAAGWYPNGIDPEVYDPSRFSEAMISDARGELGCGETDFLVTFVGTFGDWHGAEVLARAIVEGLAPAGRLNAVPIRFAFVGDGKNRAKAEGIVRSASLQTRCRFLGLVPQERTPVYLAASDCFVSPHVPNPDGSEFFGSPTKLFEYMSMGRPIVASRLGQIAEVLDHRRTGVLVDPGSVPQLIDALVELATDDGLARSLGRAARAEAIGRFTWRAHVEEIRRCYVRARHHHGAS